MILGIAVGLVWWQLASMSDTETKKFKDAIAGSNFYLVIPVAAIALASHLVRGMRWKLLIEPLGVKAHVKVLFSSILICNMANSFIPRIGEIIKCTMVSNKEKVHFEKVLGTMLVERAFDMISFIVLIIFTLIVQADKVGNFIKTKVTEFGSKEGSSLVVNLLMLATVVLFICIITFYIFKKYPENKLLQKIKSLLKGIAEGFITIKNLQKKGRFLFLTLLMWFLYLVQIYIGFYAIEGLSHLGWPAALSVLTLATLAMILTPGGLGSFPIFVMQTLALYGIVNSTGNAFGWLMWGISTSLTLVAGIVAWLLFPYLKANQKFTTETIPE